MNKIPVSFILFIAMATILFAGGCDKEDDTEFPEIIVALPNPNAIFDNGDTIRFEASISDNKKLNTIEIILVNMDNKPMLANISLIPGENPFVFKGDYIIDDLMLPGGIYQLRFRASDGINVTNYFVKIQIHELERLMLYPVIVTHPEQNKWQAFRLINGLDWQEIYTHNGDYSGSAVNSAASQLYMCGKFQSDLTAIRLSDGLTLWHVKPGIHQSERWFESVTYSHPLLYVSCAEGNIRGYDKTGSELYKSGSNPNRFPGLSVITENLVISSFKDTFSKERSLVAFHNPGGLLIHNKFISSEVVSMMLLEIDNILVFSNLNGQGSISLYNGTDNTLAEIHPFFNGVFYEAAAMDSDNFLVSASSGLFWYKYSKNSLTTFVSGIKNCQVTCDNTSQLVYASSGKTLKVYSFPFVTEVDSYLLPDTAIDLHLVFNK